MPALWACPRGVGCACLDLLLLAGGTTRRVVRRVSGWARYYLRRAALADVVCAIVGVLIAARLRFGDDVTGTYVALSLALAVLWIRALFSYTTNLGLSPGYVLVARPSATATA